MTALEAKGSATPHDPETHRAEETRPKPRHADDNPFSRALRAAYDEGFRCVTERFDLDAVEARLWAWADEAGHVSNKARAAIQQSFDAAVRDALDNIAPRDALETAASPAGVIRQTGSPSEELHRSPIIGIDTEWVQDGPERNRILSYQYAVRANNRAWSGIVFPKNLHERMTLGELLGTAISVGIRKRLISKWPEQVVAAAHWTRADLPAFKDFSKFKSKIDSVQKTYATITKPLTVSCTSNKRRRSFSVNQPSPQLPTGA